MRRCVSQPITFSPSESRTGTRRLVGGGQRSDGVLEEFACAQLGHLACEISSAEAVAGVGDRLLDIHRCDDA